MKHLILIIFLAIATFCNANIKWNDPYLAKIEVISGKGWTSDICPLYQRLPSYATAKLRKSLWKKSFMTAGLYLKFKTNAPNITVSYQVTGDIDMKHMPATGVSGIDLYEVTPKNKLIWCAPNNYTFGEPCCYKYNHLNNEKTGRVFNLFLPLYNGIKSLKIGVDDKYFFAFLPLDKRQPIVAYGTSICQGACASRPGMAWSNILQRKLRYPFINLGFTGEGQLDFEMFKLFTEINAKLYIIDCMPNMCNKNRVPLIYDRIIKGVTLLRTKTSTPILLVEHDGYNGKYASSVSRDNYIASNIELKKAYKELKKRHFKQVYYLTTKEIGLTMDAQVDGTHSSDLGMEEYAEAYYKKIKKIIKLDKEK